MASEENNNKNDVYERLTEQALFVCKEGSIHLIDLDPSWAELLLSCLHPKQRAVDTKHVDRIIRAQEAGSYVWLCDPIRIDGDGYLVDGQHRCAAVLKSGRTIKNQLLVELDLPNSIEYIDAVQKIRGPKAVQKMIGDRRTNVTVDAAIIFEGGGTFIPSSRRGLAVPERLAEVRKCPFLDELHQLYSLSGGNGIRFTSGPLAAALACMRKNRRAAMFFFGAVAINRPYTDQGVIQPAEKLCRFLLRSASSDDRGRRSGEPFMYESADKSIRAWNAWCQGRTLGNLAPSKDGKVARPMSPTRDVLATIPKKNEG